MYASLGEHSVDPPMHDRAKLMICESSPEYGDTNNGLGIPEAHAVDALLKSLHQIGNEVRLEFLHALARQNPTVRRGGTLSTLLVAAGELSMAVSINANNVEDVKSKGAPVDWVRLKEPFYAELHPIALNAFAPHPNAAKLLVDFAISQEGQELMLKFGTISSRRGMRASFIKAEDINPLLPTSGKDTAHYQELIRRIFKK